MNAKESTGYIKVGVFPTDDLVVDNSIYRNDLQTAINDCPSGQTIIVMPGTYTLTDNITINKNINIHFEAGAIVECQEFGLYLNDYKINITGYAVLNSTVTSILISNVINPIYITIKELTNTANLPVIKIDSTGYINLNVEKITCAGLIKSACVITKMDSSSILRIGYSNGQIGIDNTQTQVALGGTIKDSFIETPQPGTAGGAIDVYNDGAVTLKIINSRLYNTANNSAGAGISNEVTSGAVTINLINSIIQTTHASSKSVDSDTPATLTLIAFNSGANKAVGANVTEAVAGGLTVDANIIV